MPQFELDHVAIFAASLEEGEAFVRDSLGVDIPRGGTHPFMGTHNSLMRIGGDLYLEVIAVDPQAPRPSRSRWFGLDDFAGPPRLGTWVLRTQDIARAMAHMHPASGPAIEMARGDLTWRITVAQNGALPMSGAFPSFIAWNTPHHPARTMPDRGCRLHSMTIAHPQVNFIQRRLDGAMHADQVRFEKGAQAQISITLETPSGSRTITSTL